MLFCIYRYCTGCKKRRSLRSNSFFEEFPRISLGKILLCIYFFLEDDSQKSASRKIGLTKEKTSQIYRKLEDVCSVDLEYNPIIPFAGPGIVVKCDESKFNHKAKVSKQSVLFFFMSASRPYRDTLWNVCLSRNLVSLKEKVMVSNFEALG